MAMERPSRSPGSARASNLCRQCRKIITFERKPIPETDARITIGEGIGESTHYEHYISVSSLRSNAMRAWMPCSLCAIVWKNLSAQEQQSICRPYDEESSFPASLLHHYRVSYQLIPSEIHPGNWRLGFTIPVPSKRKGTAGKEVYSKTFDFITKEIGLAPMKGKFAIFYRVPGAENFKISLGKLHLSSLTTTWVIQP